MRKSRLVVSTVLVAMAATFTAMAGSWKSDSNGWWYDEGNGSYPKSTWSWIDGNNDCVSECYYFDDNGYCLMDTTTPDNYMVDSNGAWVVDGVVQTKGTSANSQQESVQSDWIDIMPHAGNNNNQITFDGSSYHIRANVYSENNSWGDNFDEALQHEYILDSNTICDLPLGKDIDSYFPEYQEGDTSVQWFTRYYNHCSEYGFWWAEVYKVKVTGNHIDKIAGIWSIH